MSSARFNARPSDGWSTCESGDVGRLVSGLRRRRRNRTLAAATGIAACVLIVAWAPCAAMQSPPHDPLIAGIRCSEVRSMIADYASGNVSPDKQVRISAHLENCPPCREAYEGFLSMQSDPLTDRSEAPASKSRPQSTVAPTATFVAAAGLTGIDPVPLWVR